MSQFGSFVIDSASPGTVQKSNRYNGTRVVYNSKAAEEKMYHFVTDQVILSDNPVYEVNTFFQPLNDYKTTTSLVIESEDFSSTPYLCFSTFGVNNGFPGQYYPFVEHTFTNICIAGATWSSSSVDFLNLYKYTDNGDRTYTRELFATIDMSEYKDNQPLMYFFNEVTTHKVDIEFVGMSVGISLSLVYLGDDVNALIMPNGPDEGFMPAKWNNGNTTRTNIQSGDGFGPVQTYEGLRPEKYTFSEISVDFMNLEYRAFLSKFRYFPVFSQWNSFLESRDTIFGKLTKQPCSYVTVGTSRIAFDIMGVI